VFDKWLSRLPQRLKSRATHGQNLLSQVSASAGGFVLGCPQLSVAGQIYFSNTLFENLWCKTTFIVILSEAKNLFSGSEMLHSVQHDSLRHAEMLQFG
jgi:hypothetical protein